VATSISAVDYRVEKRKRMHYKKIDVSGGLSGASREKVNRVKLLRDQARGLSLESPLHLDIILKFQKGRTPFRNEEG